MIRSFQVACLAFNGVPQVDPSCWPSQLGLQLIGNSVMQAISREILSSSKHLSITPDPSEALDKLYQ